MFGVVFTRWYVLRFNGSIFFPGRKIILVTMDGICEEQALSEQLQGIRIDQATKKGSVIDTITIVTQMNSRNAPKALSRLDQKLQSECQQLRINGKGRETPVADAKTLIQIIWALGGKKAREFRIKCAEYICRVLGGDPSLVREMEIRAEHTSQEQRDFFMQGIETPALDPMCDPEYLKRRVHAANQHNDLCELMHIGMPRAGRDVYTAIHAAIAEAIMGLIPSAFKTAHDIPQRYNAPDIMMRKQLDARNSLLAVGCDMLTEPGNPHIGSDGKMFEKEFIAMCDQAGKVFAKFHGQYQAPTELPQVREAHGLHTLPAMLFNLQRAVNQNTASAILSPAE
jgi:hypothetical protein